MSTAWGRGPARRQDHVILTRFNLPSPGYESLLRAEPGWLHRRAALFETYCLPSVMAQTSQDFDWIVYFDPDSPAWLRRRIANWALYSRLHPVFRTQVSRAQKLADIAALSAHPAKRLLTTNLDNDDALAADFIARLQAASPETGRLALYLGQGLIRRGARLYRHRDPYNAFCSVSEDWPDAQTCWVSPHPDLPRSMPAVVLSGAPGWLQVVHGGNVSNRVRGRRCASAPYRPLFPHGLDGVGPVGVPALLGDAVLIRPFRFAAGLGRTVLRAGATHMLGPSGVDRIKTAWHGWRFPRPGRQMDPDAERR